MLRYSQGGAITWDRSGSAASLTNKLLTANALAVGYGREGGYVDLVRALSGSGSSRFPKTWLVILEYESGTQPTKGGWVYLFGSWSHDASTWPGGATGVDGGYQDGSADTWIAQLDSLGSVTNTADANTVQRSAFTITAKARYFTPVVYNNTDQDFRDNSDTHATKITMLPLIESDDA